MKTHKFFLVAVLFLSMAFYTEAQTHTRKVPENKVNHRGGQHGGRHGGHGRPVGAPLDGGLLSILGIAGVTYYLVRKRKKGLKPDKITGY